MPKQTLFRANLPDLVQCNAENLALYIYVTAQKDLAPSLEIKDCIIRFMEKYNITEEEWPVSTALHMYYRYSDYGFKHPKIQK